MEELILNYESFIMHPEKLYKSGGIWLSDSSNDPFTGRVEIYNDIDKKNKILECTIVNGLKHGIFAQYLDMSAPELPGIIGLYMMDQKRADGLLQSQWEVVKNALNLVNFPLKSTYIGYRNGLRDGAVRISDLLSGRYYNGKKNGVWYFFMDPENKDLWTIKHRYEEDVLEDSECRELINGGIFELNCDAYELKYTSNYVLRQLDLTTKNNDQDDLNRFVIKDVNGIDVEIIVEDSRSY